MKKLLLSILLSAIVGGLSLVNAQVNLDSGLVACYPFNGNANDASGNGNNATVVNATFTTDRFGNSNSAYHFNGSDAKIWAIINNLPFGNTSRSISVWANGSNNVSEMSVTSYGDPNQGISGDEYAINYFNYQVLPGWGTGINLDFANGYVASDSGFGNSWKHIVAVYDSTTNKISLYINNVLVKEMIKALNTTHIYFFDFTIGAEREGSSQTWRWFDGDIDDIHIYNRVLNLLEIDSLYHGGGCSAAIAPPVASFQANDTTICTNNYVNFSNLSTNATSWQWNFQGGNPDTSTSQNPQNIYYQTGGAYNVTLTASNNSGSDTLTFNNYITVHPAPPTPNITQSHDTLYCSNNPTYISYQWYSDATMITGATDTFLVIMNNGNYNVKVTSTNGCLIAAGINIDGIKEFSGNNDVSLFPNPASNQLTIHTSSIHNEAVTVSIMNMLGQTMQEEKTMWSNDIDINIKNLSAGIYFLEMKTESGSVVKKFVKE